MHKHEATRLSVVGKKKALIDGHQDEKGASPVMVMGRAAAREISGGRR